MLTEDHRESLTDRGFAVVSGLVPFEVWRAARDAICRWVHADLERPETWYEHEALDWSVVPVHHAQAFWDVRQWPALHAAFADLWGTESLWVTMDRAIFKLPKSDAHRDYVDLTEMHWDIDPRSPNSEMYQAMLFLTDVAPGEGTFECVPSIFRHLAQYLDAHPGPLVEAPVDLDGHEVVSVPARAGDLVVWNARLPHRGGFNHGVRPRVSLAVTMHPVGSEAERQERIECWRKKRAPVWWRGWKGQVDPEPGEPARLTALGRRLVGVDPWPAA